MRIRHQGRRFRVKAPAGLVLAGLLVSAGPAAPQEATARRHQEPEDCRETARASFYACRLENLEDYGTDYANCDKLEGDARSECRHDARSILNEANEACEDRYDRHLESCARPGKDIGDPWPPGDSDYVARETRSCKILAGLSRPEGCRPRACPRATDRPARIVSIRCE